MQLGGIKMTNIVRWIKVNQQAAIMLVISSVAVLVMGVIFLGKRETVTQTESSIEKMSEEETTETSGETVIYADVKGAVLQPGMYQIGNQARVLDVVNMAGGFTEEADQNQVNFAQIVEDQMVIYIPTSAEDLEQWQERQAGERANGVKQTASSKVNLNTADSLTLQQLNGIGEKKAAAIIAYREEHGSFKTVEDLKKVSGIGDKTVENLKDEIDL